MYTCIQARGYRVRGEIHSQRQSNLILLTQCCILALRRWAGVAAPDLDPELALVR